MDALVPLKVPYGRVSSGNDEQPCDPGLVGEDGEVEGCLTLVILYVEDRGVWNN